MRAPGVPHRRARQAHRPVLLGLLRAAALWLLIPGVASAHAHLVQADPAPDSVIAHAPTVASFLFDEPLNPALTRVRITDAAGRQVTTDTGHLAPGHHGELWELWLPWLPAGTYSVFWTSESATDGHVMSSFYTFRIAPSGGAARFGAVTGTAAGVYGGGTGNGSGVALSGGVAATTIFSWLGLMAQALWLGALVIELAVLAPARRAVKSPAACLAWAAAPRLWWLARAGPVVAVWALVGDVLSLAVQGTGGDWGRALAPATLGGILSSQNGRFIVLRLAVLLAALLLTGRVRPPAVATTGAPTPEKVRRAPQALGITAPAPATLHWEVVRGVAALLAATYMLLVAFSGHAADVTPGWLSYPIDWLHLLFTAAWIGGIAALAYGVLPLRRALAPEERAMAVLPLLDRFSPVAYLAVAVLALSGLYNAVNHLDAPAKLAGTTYGQLLVLKLLLVGLLMLLSASHVWGHRPHITRLHKRGQRDAHAMAGVHEGLATLAARLRLETGVGAAILLATALMGQTLPPTGTPSGAVASSGAVPAAISGTAVTGDLRAQLTVAPPAVGASTFTLQIWEKRTSITGDTGAAIIHLYPAAQPTLRANLTPVAHGTRFTVRGSLATAGTGRGRGPGRTATGQG